MTQVSAHADHDRRHYRFERMRADRLYIPLEPTPAPIRAWRWDIFAAVTVVVLGYLCFPIAAWLAVVVAQVWP